MRSRWDSVSSGSQIFAAECCPRKCQRHCRCWRFSTRRRWSSRAATPPSRELLLHRRVTQKYPAGVKVRPEVTLDLRMRPLGGSRGLHFQLCCRPVTTCENISSTRVLFVRVDESLHPDCLSWHASHLLPGFPINNLCALLSLTTSTHGVRFTAEVPRDRTPTGGPGGRSVPAAGACPPAICQSGWGTGAQTSETSVYTHNTHWSGFFSLTYLLLYM